MSPEVFAVHPSVPARNLKGFIALAKARPAALNFATIGTGGITRMALELFKLTAKVNVQHVDYKGAAQGLTDLMGGYVHGMVVDFSVLYPHIKQGKLRALVVTSERRNPLLPDLQTAAEQGLPQLFAVNWYAVMAAPKTPRPLIDKLHGALVKVATSPDVKARFIEMGSEPMTSTSPEAFTSFLKEELQRWGKVAKAAGVQAE
jgi:tripartite-type tricarboxylate transporter receptor subunit TctC